MGVKEGEDVPEGKGRLEVLLEGRRGLEVAVIRGETVGNSPKTVAVTVVHWEAKSMGEAVKVPVAQLEVTRVTVP